MQSSPVVHNLPVWQVPIHHRGKVQHPIKLVMATVLLSLGRGRRGLRNATLAQADGRKHTALSETPSRPCSRQLLVDLEAKTKRKATAHPSLPMCISNLKQTYAVFVWENEELRPNAAGRRTRDLKLLTKLRKVVRNDVPAKKINCNTSCVSFKISHQPFLQI